MVGWCVDLSKLGFAQMWTYDMIWFVKFEICISVLGLGT
jgi:hypothetical protein